MMQRAWYEYSREFAIVVAVIAFCTLLVIGAVWMIL